MTECADKRKRNISVAKKLLFSACAVVVGLVMLEGLCSVSWFMIGFNRFLQSNRVVVAAKDLHCQHDPQLGWNHIPGKRIPDFYAPGRHITINQDGLRGQDNYIGRKDTGRIRIVCLGNSNTLGYGVGDKDTYPARLETYHKRIQVMNMGQGGYSLGQSYLWYKRLEQKVEADILLFTFIVDNIRRLGAIRTPNGYSRPTFSLENSRLVLNNVPAADKLDVGDRIMRAGEMRIFLTRRSAIARTVEKLINLPKQQRTDSDGDLLQVALAIFAELHRSALANGTQFAIVLLPTIQELPNLEFSYRPGQELYHGVSTAVRRFTGEKQIPFLDLYPTLAALDPKRATSFFQDDDFHHYTPVGNQFLARRIHEWLSQSVKRYPRAQADRPVSH